MRRPFGQVTYQPRPLTYVDVEDAATPMFQYQPRAGTIETTPLNIQYRPPADRPACLVAEQVLKMASCFSAQPPPGMDATTWQNACALARAGGFFEMPMCPGQPMPPIPGCADADWITRMLYCEQYPQNDGPNPFLNAMCWAGRRDMSWYQSALSVPSCDTPPPTAYTPPPAEPPIYIEPESTPTTEKIERNYLMWGGILLAVVAVGGAGVYYATRKRR